MATIGLAIVAMPDARESSGIAAAPEQAGAMAGSLATADRHRLESLCYRWNPPATRRGSTGS